MANNIYKLQTNIPVTITLKYVDFQQSRTQGYSDQIRVKGTIEGFPAVNDQGQPTDGAIYLPLRCEEELAALGVISGRQQSGNYTLLMKPATIRIVRTEDGNRKFTNIELLEGTAVPQAASQQPTTASSRTNLVDKRAEFASLSLSFDTCIEEAIKIVKKTSYAQVATFNDISGIAIALFGEMARRNLLRTVKPTEQPQQPATVVPQTQSSPPQQGLFGNNLPSLLAPNQTVKAAAGGDIPF